MDAAEFAAWTGGVLAAIGILAAVWKVVRAGHRAANRLERIERLATELAPNGGGSIKDAVHRIEARVGENSKILADHHERILKTEGRVEAIALVTSPTMLIEDEGGVLRESRGSHQGGTR